MAHKGKIDVLAGRLKKKGRSAIKAKTPENSGALRAVFLVDREGIEPPTQGFSVLCSTN